MRRAALLLSLVAANCYAEPPPLEFKGVQLGASVEQLLAAVPEFECSASRAFCSIYVDLLTSKLCGISPQAFQTCRPEVMQRMAYGPAFVQRYDARFRGGQLGKVSVSFHSNWFAKVIIALTEKFGPPTSDETPQISNRMGAKFDNRTVVWERPDALLRAEQRFGTIDGANVTIVSKAFAKAESDEIEANAKQGAKGL